MAFHNPVANPYLCTGKVFILERSKSRTNHKALIEACGHYDTWINIL